MPRLRRSVVLTILALPLVLGPAAAYTGFQLASLLDTGEMTSRADMKAGMGLLIDQTGDFGEGIFADLIAGKTKSGD